MQTMIHQGRKKEEQKTMQEGKFSPTRCKGHNRKVGKNSFIMS